MIVLYDDVEYLLTNDCQRIPIRKQVGPDFPTSQDTVGLDPRADFEVDNDFVERLFPAHLCNPVSNLLPKLVNFNSNLFILVIT